jgi:hypothetical protein
MNRYFILSTEDKEKKDYLIEINKDASLEKRIKCVNLNKTFKFLKHMLSDLFYVLDLNEGELNKNEFNIGIILTKYGNVILYNQPQNFEIYFREISENEFNSLNEKTKINPYDLLKVPDFFF